MLPISEAAKPLKQSAIRSASTRCALENGINLGQGVCDLPTPPSVKQKAASAIEANKNLYSACEGVAKLRDKLAEKLSQFNNIHVDPNHEIIVTHGATGAFVCATVALLNPHDEVILFEPFYGYHKNILELHNITVKSVPIGVDDFSINYDDLHNCITEKTRAIVVCTPCNPSGKVFSKDELRAIGHIAEQHDLLIITDEIYEYITYPGFTHVSMASLDNFAQRTITISGFSKTYNMTGWRLGYACGPQYIIEKMALIQDLLYVCPVTPLQYACIEALDLPKSYYTEMNELYLEKRDFMVESLMNLGFKVVAPQGAYYIMADCSGLGLGDDQQTVDALFTQAKVAFVPGRAFYVNPERGKNVMRVCYALKMEVLKQAIKNIEKFLKA